MPLDGAFAQSDLNYLFFRQQVERCLAETAASAAARRVHRELAELYQQRIGRLTAGNIGFPFCQTEQSSS